MFSRGTVRCALRAILIMLVVPGMIDKAHGDDLDNITFKGTAFDSAGADIPDATITAHHLQTGTRREAMTDARGRYRLMVTLSGAYKLSAGASGFRESSTELDALSGRAITLR